MMWANGKRGNRRTDFPEPSCLGRLGIIFQRLNKLCLRNDLLSLVCFSPPAYAASVDG